MGVCAKCHRHPTEPCGDPDDCGYVLQYPTEMKGDPIIAEVSVFNARTKQHEVLRFRDTFQGQAYHQELTDLGIKSTLLLTHVNEETKDEYKYQKQRDTK